MTTSEEPGPPLPELPAREPTRELLLAQALEACIRAERREPGSSQTIIGHQPPWAKADLEKMVGLAGSLDAVATNAIMSEEFRVAARARLMRRIGASAAVAATAERRAAHGAEPRVVPAPRLGAVPTLQRAQPIPARPAWRWFWRGCVGLMAGVVAVAGTLIATSRALPGEPLYGLKQAEEELGLRLAADDQARALALLRTADARLDETARLLRQGRSAEAGRTTLRYNQAVERATTTFVVTIDNALSDGLAVGPIDTKLTEQQAQLQAMLGSAPELARADLRQALVATERSRALVADPRPVARALGRASSNQPVVAAAAPTVAAEDLPTAVPTRRPVIAQLAPLAPKPLVIAQAPLEGSPPSFRPQVPGDNAARADTSGPAETAALDTPD